MVFLPFLHMQDTVDMHIIFITVECPLNVVVDSLAKFVTG